MTRGASRIPRVMLAALLAACGTAPAPSAPASTLDSVSPGASAAASNAEPSVTASVPPGSTWQLLDDAPVARLEMAVTAHEGRIWLAGGLSPLGEALTDVEIFDPASGEWSDGPSLPTGIHHAALVSDGERIMLIGGYLGSSFERPTDLVLVFFDEEGWVTGPLLPEARAAGAAAWDGARIVYAGGVGPNGVVIDVLALEDGTWSDLGTMSGPREHLAAASDGAGRTWLLGGRVGGLDTNVTTVEVVEGDEITLGTPLSVARGGVAAFHVPGLGACLTGGESPTVAHTDVECVGGDGSLTSLPDLVEPHHGHGAAVVGSTAYVLLGGPQPALTADATVEALDLAALAR